MANQFEKGRAFSPGDTVEAADLNNLVDLATGISGLITEQSTVVPDQRDQDMVLYYDANAAPPNRLRKCKIESLGAGTVTSVSMSVTPTSAFNLTGSPITTFGTFALSLKNQNRNLFLASSVDTNGQQPAFRAIAPQDTNALVSVAAYVIDLDLGHTFWKVLPDAGAPRTFKLKNGTPGQVIKVIVQQAAAPGTNTVAWDTDEGADVVRWPSGTSPVMSTGAHATDIFEFTVLKVGAGIHNYYGIRWGANFQL